MLAKKRPSDILEKILCFQEKQTRSSKQHEELESLIYLFGASCPCSPETESINQKKTGKNKKKVTNYLSHETLEGIKKVQNELLVLFPEERKNIFSCSNIVDKAVQLMLEKLKNEKTKRFLINSLLSEK
jgi:hypothetical protein